MVLFSIYFWSYIWLDILQESPYSKSNYKKAHAAFHNADYSTALKYACLSLQNSKDQDKNEIAFGADI